MNVIYTINTIISLFLYFIGRRNKKKYYIVVSYVLVTVRNAIRMMDLEDSFPYIKNNTYFVSMIVKQELVSGILAIIFVIYFHSIKGHKYYMIMFMVIWMVS